MKKLFLLLLLSLSLMSMAVPTTASSEVLCEDPLSFDRIYQETDLITGQPKFIYFAYIRIAPFEYEEREIEISPQAAMTICNEWAEFEDQ